MTLDEEYRRRFGSLTAVLARLAGIHAWLPEKFIPKDGIWGRAEEPLWTVMVAVDLRTQVGWEALDRLAALLKAAQDRDVPVALEHCPHEGWESAATHHVTYVLRGRCDPARLGQEWDALCDRWREEKLPAWDAPQGPGAP